MSLNKFTNTSTGFELDLDIGCDELKANNITTDNIDLVTINGQVQASYNSYAPNFTATEGAVVTFQPDVSTLSIGNALYLDSKVAVNLPNNGVLTFDVEFDIPGLYTVLPSDKCSMANGTETGQSNSTYTLVKLGSSIDINVTPARYTLTLKRSDGTPFNNAVNALTNFHIVIESNG
jgi:hypothetical protein